MKYLLLCCIDEARWGALSQSQRDEIMRSYGELIGDLHRSGKHLESAQLKSVSTAVTVRSSNGRPVVTDGPFAETKEQIGGYHLLECASRDEAVAIAKRIPTLAYGGVVEVRPLFAT